MGARIEVWRIREFDSDRLGEKVEKGGVCQRDIVALFEDMLKNMETGNFPLCNHFYTVYTQGIHIIGLTRSS